MDIHALRKRGWSISAIARHVGRDRKTVKAYLHGKREVGIRAPAGDDAFAAYLTYSTARLVEDPHLWATALFDEVTALGYDRSYPSFTRALRRRGVRRRASRAIRRRAVRSRSSTTRPGRKPNGTGLNCRTHPPAGTGTASAHICWWERCLTLQSGAECCVNRWNNHSWPTPNTRSRCGLVG